MGHLKGHEFWLLILDLRGTESKNPFYEQRLLAARLIVVTRLVETWFCHEKTQEEKADDGSADLKGLYRSIR